MKDKAEAAVKALITKTKAAKDPNDALVYSHAAVNIAHAYATFQSAPIRPEDPTPSAE